MSNKAAPSEPSNTDLSTQHISSTVAVNHVDRRTPSTFWTGKVPKAEATGHWPKGQSSYNPGWLKFRVLFFSSYYRIMDAFSGSDSTRTRIFYGPGDQQNKVRKFKVLKFGKHVRLSEAFALQLVAANTSVPVPKVFCAFTRKGITYIFMEYIVGVPLNEVWDEMSKEDQERIVGELKGYFEQLRQIPRPRPGTICTAAGDDHPVCPYRTPNIEKGAGPWQNEEDFNVFLRSGPPDDSAESGKDAQMLKDYIEKQDNGHEICFTHGDAAPRNIMVARSRSSGECHVAALIDFEMAGFLPEYWEYTAARVPSDGKGPTYWNAEVDKFLKPYPKELEMEDKRLSYFGRYGGS